MKIEIWKTKKNTGGNMFPKVVETEEVEFDVDDDYTDVLGTDIRFPHCDSLILHSPGVCEFCDRHPDWQALRSAQGIAFSDTSEDVRVANNLLPCPSTYYRTAEVRDRWYGNVPKSTG